MMSSAKAVCFVTVCLIWSMLSVRPNRLLHLAARDLSLSALHRPVIAFGVGHQQIDLPAVGENDEFIGIAVIEAGEYRRRFQRFGRRQRQILQLAAVELGVVAVINGDVRLPGARQHDNMLAAFGRRFFHPLIAKLAIAAADGLGGIVHVASPRDMDAGAGISHRRASWVSDNYYKRLDEAIRTEISLLG